MKLRLHRRAVLTDLSRPRLGEIAPRPNASGVHVTALGAIGLTPVNRNDERGIEPRSSHPHEEGTLR